jgi:hypothetical protein
VSKKEFIVLNEVDLLVKMGVIVGKKAIETWLASTERFRVMDPYDYLVKKVM